MLISSIFEKKDVREMIVKRMHVYHHSACVMRGGSRMKIMNGRKMELKSRGGRCRRTTPTQTDGGSQVLTVFLSIARSAPGRQHAL
jgi:hypothetical protein